MNWHRRCPCTIHPESTSARRGELYAELRRHERVHFVGLAMGLRSRLTHLRQRLDLILLDWPPRRGPRFHRRRSLAEAAQVPSRHLTEPMRGGRRRPQLAPLSRRRSLAVSRSRQDRGGDHVSPISPRTTPPFPRKRVAVEGAQGRDRARCLAWTAPGTERFLGRALRERPRGKWECGITISVATPLALSSESEESRRCTGTCHGPTPYSCLAPPRLTASKPKQPSSGRPCSNHPGAEADDFEACEDKSIARRMPRKIRRIHPSSGVRA